MADDLLIALPDLSVQRDMARTERALVAARRHLIDSHRELWNDPKKRSDIYREANRLIPSADLAQWTASLPFPIASALWAYESKGDNNLHARHAQMFHFWDATIQFHATVVLSALLQDRSRLEQELLPSPHSSTTWESPPSAPPSASGTSSCSASPRDTALH